MAETIKKKGRPRKTSMEIDIPKPKGGRGPRPHIWKCGPDPKLHAMYMPWLRAKSQSDYRLRQGLEVGEFKLSFDDWVELWGENWNFRGKGPDSYCMTRKDYNKDWVLDNCEIVGRLEHLRRQSIFKVEKNKRNKNK